jgi:hypothetical protein
MSSCQTVVILPGQAEANIGKAVLFVSDSLYRCTNSLQLSKRLKFLENVVSNTL